MAKKKIDFEAALMRLEEIASLMSQEDLPLEQSLALFAEAAELSSLCGRVLSDARLQVEKIAEKVKETNGKDAL